MLLLLQSSAPAASSIIDVSWFDLSLAFGLILIAVSLSRWQHLGLAKDFIIGAIRTIVQLVLVGYVLVYIFAANRWYITVAALLLMLTVATFAAVGRQKNRRGQSIHWLTGTAMLLGSVFILIFLAVVAVGVPPWYAAR